MPTHADVVICITKEEAAEQAQQILEEWMKEGLVVTSHVKDIWHAFRGQPSAHRMKEKALLIKREKIDAK